MNTLNDDLVSEVLQRNTKWTLDSHPEVSATCVEDKQRLMACIRESTKGVFSTMCGLTLEAGAEGAGTDSAPRYGISGVIGLSGRLSATIVVSIDLGLIYTVAENMLGTRPTKIDGDTIDLVGELANMIGGNAKERMSMESLTLGLPTVVAGDAHFIAYGSNMEISSMQFSCEAGPLTVEMGFVC